MAKGKGDGGNKKSQIGLSLSAASSMQNPQASMGEQFRGVAADAAGMAIGAGIALVTKFILDKICAKFFGGKAGALPSAPDFNEDGVKFGLRKSIEKVSNDEGRQLQPKDFKLVADAYFSFPGNAGMEPHRPQISGFLAEMLRDSALTAELAPDSDDDEDDDKSGDDND